MNVSFAVAVAVTQMFFGVMEAVKQRIQHEDVCQKSYSNSPFTRLISLDIHVHEEPRWFVILRYFKTEMRFYTEVTVVVQTEQP